MLAKITKLLNGNRAEKEQLGKLYELLGRVVSDGVVTADEVSEIQRFMRDTGLSLEASSRIRDTVFNQVLSHYVSDRKITPQERDSLLHIGRMLGVSMAALAQAQSQVEFFSLLEKIESSPFDQLPHNNGASGIHLGKGELDYFCHSANLLEERVVRSRSVGRSAGLGFRVTKGVSFRVGQSRGHIVSDRDIVPISFGDFVITNQRLVFVGDRKSVNAPLPKLLDLDIFGDGLRFSLTNRQKPVTVQFFTAQPAEIAGMLLSRILNQ